MDSLLYNKFAGAVLGTLLFMMALTVFSGAVFYVGKPKTPGYDLPAAAPVEVASDKPAAPVEPLPVLLASAEVKKGQADAQVCTTCHNFEKGAAAKIGPGLYGVLGRPKAIFAGFNYSEAMKAKGGEWTFDELNAFIENPRGYVPGTKMTYAGEKDAHKRADIIDYLDSLADTPVPLPKP